MFRITIGFEGNPDFTHNSLNSLPLNANRQLIRPPGIMMSGPAKGGNYVIMSQCTSFQPIRILNLLRFNWLCTHAMFDVTCFCAFVGASDVISSVVSIC